VLLFVLSPQFAFKPYEVEDRPIITVIPVEDFKMPPEPADIAPPPVVAPVPEDDPDAGEIPEYDPEKLMNVPLRSPKNKPARLFHAFEKRPSLIYSEAPRYPDLAREAGIEGTVYVDVLVGSDGKVLTVRIRSSDVTTAMEKAALEAARKCRFIPAKQRTVPVKAYVTIPYHFRLTD
jgi:protein TonB